MDSSNNGSVNDSINTSGQSTSLKLFLRDQPLTSKSVSKCMISERLDLDFENIDGKSDTQDRNVPLVLTHSHCLVCNVEFNAKTISGESINVYTHFNTDIKELEITVLQKIAKVLDRTLESINLHSEEVCDVCYRLLISHHELEVKLQILCSDIEVQFDSSSEMHKTTMCTKIEPKITSSNQPSVKSRNISLVHEVGGSTTVSIPKSMLIITDEGKVVDENGMETNPLVTSISRSTDTSCRSTKPLTTLANSVKLNKKSQHIKRPYLCSVCGKGFRAFSHRVEHMLIHLGEKPWSCDECKKMFRTKSALKIHFMKHTGERPFICADCGKSFSDKYYFDEHCRIHSGERPFECSYCTRLFARKKDLAVHLKAHTGDKPFKCTSCPKTFAVKSRLDRHSRTHSGIKPHSCEFCNKLFSRQDDYKVHIRQHTGERPFHCDYCSKTFTNKSNCVVHMRTHTGSKAFNCFMCNASFDRRLKVEEHMAQTHNIPSNTLAIGTECPQRKLPAIPSETESFQAPENKSSVCTPVNLQSIPLTQPLFSDDSVHSFALSDARSIQGLGLPVGQGTTTHVWSESTSFGTTFVNIPPGTFVNIITEGSNIINAESCGELPTG